MPIKRCHTCKRAYTLRDLQIRCRDTGETLSAFKEACPSYGDDPKKLARGWGVLKMLNDLTEVRDD
jgi:hypothetical protein